MILEKKTFKLFSQKLDIALRLASELGVRWENTRFSEYKALCDEAADRIYPRKLEPEEREKELLFYEATAQCQQLIDSTEFWQDPKIDKIILKKKLIKVMQGEVRSPDGQEDDAPRNTLLELTTAAFLKSKRFDVVLTACDADVLATKDGLSFSVECKRPTHKRTIENNLKKLSRQLAQRCQDNSTIGIAVLGLDRAIDLGSALADVYITGKQEEVQVCTMAMALTFPDCKKVIEDQTIGAKDFIFDTIKNGRIEFVPSPQIGAVILSGSVYIQNEHAPYTVKQMTLFPLNWQSQSESLLKRVSHLFNDHL